MSKRDSQMSEAEKTQPGEPLLEVRNLYKQYELQKSIFKTRRQTVNAATDISFTVQRGEVVGLVGESGSGKTTIGRSVLRLVEPTSGEVHFNGVDLRSLNKRAMQAQRRHMQIVFQDPFASLNPRQTVRRILEAPLQTFRLEKTNRKEAIERLLSRVGLNPSHLKSYPHEFSGGQRQRIGIARAISVQPEFLVADEPVSSLDVSVQAQVINLLRDLQREMNLAILFIAHDLSVVEYISDRVIVLYLGRIMEIASSRDLYSNPRHPYTQALLSAVPIPDPTVRRKTVLLKGDIPSPLRLPTGCVFRTRCPVALADCAEVVPPLVEIAPGRFRACIL